MTAPYLTHRRRVRPVRPRPGPASPPAAAHTADLDDQPVRRLRRTGRAPRAQAGARLAAQREYLRKLADAYRAAGTGDPDRIGLRRRVFLAPTQAEADDIVQAAPDSFIEGEEISDPAVRAVLTNPEDIITRHPRRRRRDPHRPGPRPADRQPAAVDRLPGLHRRAPRPLPRAHRPPPGTRPAQGGPVTRGNAVLTRPAAAHPGGTAATAPRVACRDRDPGTSGDPNPDTRPAGTRLGRARRRAARRAAPAPAARIGPLPCRVSTARHPLRSERHLRLHESRAAGRAPSAPADRRRLARLRRLAARPGPHLLNSEPA